MGIRKLLLESIIILAVITFLVVTLNGFQIYRNASKHFAKLQEQYFDATYEIYKDEIIGGLIVDDKEIENALLNEISSRRGMGLSVSYKGDDIRAGNFVIRAPMKTYELDLGNGNKAILTLYPTNSLKIPWVDQELSASLLLEALVLGLGFMYLWRRFNKKLLAPLADLASNLKPGQIEIYVPKANTVFELKELSDTLKLMNIEMQKQALFEAEANTAKQVAHDIRGPLITFDRILNQFIQLPEKERLLLRNAVQRITDIANNLLAKHQNVIDANSTVKQAELISDLLSRLVSEKRIQHKDLNIDFQLEITSSAYYLFAIINSITFKQAISNLIDNAAEAITGDSGKIIINLNKVDDQWLELQIEDNGCGIQKEIIPKILEGGFTSKIHGHGIGLRAAKQIIKFCGGVLSIDSEVNYGTKITIMLPQSEPAPWFVNRITIGQDSIVVILDDDEPIHYIWDEYFKAQALPGDNVQLKHFYNPQDLTEFYSNHISGDLFFLIDQELLNQGISGLSLIEKLDVAKQAILVTNQYDNKIVREEAQKLGVKIIPKNFVSHVPLEIICKNPDYVLLDDSPVIGGLWQLAAEKAGKRVVFFDDPEKFMTYVLKCSKTTQIYIDSELELSIKGEAIAKELYELGYTSLYLATAYPASKFKHVTWVKGIIDKDPPY